LESAIAVGKGWRPKWQAVWAGRVSRRVTRQLYPEPEPPQAGQFTIFPPGCGRRAVFGGGWHGLCIFHGDGGEAAEFGGAGRRHEAAKTAGFFRTGMFRNWKG